jgi:hypothetical protein
MESGNFWMAFGLAGMEVMAISLLIPEIAAIVTSR